MRCDDGACNALKYEHNMAYAKHQKGSISAVCLFFSEWMEH